MKMATYPGMSLRGEVRESISLDEDDLSDVEDEVFIRDGKNGYKLAEELNVKRPLMAPRRKPGRPDTSTRLKNKPPCKAFCKPCCYVSVALSVLIGLIILVVVLVSIYPLPLDWLRDWYIKKSQTDDSRIKLVPCSSLKVTDVWSVNLPKFTSESPIRTLDVNGDGIEDILFGFGTGDHSNIPPDTFCPIYMGVPPPCEGGIIAINGMNGTIIWTQWLNDTIFSVQCTIDINGDSQNDCLAVGAGTILIINSNNGSTVWQSNSGRMNVYAANFIADLNNDSIPDILASHSALNAEKEGHIILFSGKNGQEINRVTIPNGANTFYMPQMLKNSMNTFIVFGSGSPYTPGNLSLAPVSDIVSGVLSNQTKTVYQDKTKGIFTQSVLVDITGDRVPDIITAMYNSTIVAINGETFDQIWNYTIPNSESNVSPTPGYFNGDNVTDFLVIYQKYDDILDNNYTQTFIINGKTGESIYSPISGGMITQMGGLTLSMEGHGSDLYLFWTAECTNLEMFNKVEIPKGKDNLYAAYRRQFNTTRILRLNGLNKNHEPPGFTVYNSVERIPKEFNNSKSVIRQLQLYYLSHPKIQIGPAGQAEVDENFNMGSLPIGIRKYGGSNFRHKDGHMGIVKDYPNNNPVVEEQELPIPDQDYDWLSQNQPPNLLNDLENVEPEFNPIDDTIPYNQKHLLVNKNADLSSSRDPRSKEQRIKSSKASEPNTKSKGKSTTKKKNLSDKQYGIYDYKNVRLARNRLLHDVNNIPTDILKDTFLKNEESRLKKSKFEQRDINSHNYKIKEHEEIQRVIDEEKAALENNTLNLWDLESEKEMTDWTDGNYRGKRDVNYTYDSITKITSVGAVLNSFNVTNDTNTIDIVFITYWQPNIQNVDDILKQDIRECIEDKILQKEQDQAHDYQQTTDKEQRALFQRECLEEQENLKNEFTYFKELYQLRLGQMTVYRLRIECQCGTVNQNERCVNFLPKDDQSWPSYLGKHGDGVFFTRD